MTEEDRLLRLLAASTEAAKDAVSEEPTALAPESIQGLEAALLIAKSFQDAKREKADMRRMAEPEKKQAPMDEALVDRGCANMIIRALVQLIESNPSWREQKLAAPVAKLSGALRDLNYGKTRPILRRKSGIATPLGRALYTTRPLEEPRPALSKL
jgi:hypothetical protein